MYYTLLFKYISIMHARKERGGEGEGGWGGRTEITPYYTD